MADKKPMVKGPDIYIGGKSKFKKKSWEAKELGEINRNWKRPVGTREHQRQMSVKRASSSQKKSRRRSSKS